ncbi:hypothetical protein KEM52_006216 [Ascosphaera acerosa]|nr:hypothetical protein KEM52_006216 [Ascosphaera acerosa]
MSSATSTFKPSGLYRRQSPASKFTSGDPQVLLVDDTYHLLNLAGPADTHEIMERVNCHWPHYRSKDLVNWTLDEEPALVAGTDVNDPDANGVWAGCVVTGPDGNMHVFYAGYSEAQEQPQCVVHAKASDPHGNKFEKQGVIKISEATKGNLLGTYEMQDFRDPFVFFNEEEKKWWMIVSARLNKGPKWTRGALALLTSEDFETWDVEKEPLYAPNDVHVPECPELFQLGEKWYLIYARYIAPEAGAAYLIADSPRGPFRHPPGGRYLDGRRWYALKSCPKAGDASKRIAFGWIGDRIKEDSTWLWGGDTAAPREMWVGDDLSLRIGPCQEVLEGMFESKPAYEADATVVKRLGGMEAKFLEHPSTSPEKGQLVTFQAKPVPGTTGYGLLLRCDQDWSGYWLNLFPRRREGDTTYHNITLTMSPFTLDDWTGPHHQYTRREIEGTDFVRLEDVPIKDGETGRLVLLDDMIEFFIGGRALTWRWGYSKYERDNADAPLGVFVQDGEVEFETFKVFMGC